VILVYIFFHYKGSPFLIPELLFITNEFGKTLDEGKEIRVVFCDISKAFDRVWHIGLLKKLESIRIQGPLLSWIKNYLSNRKQRVVINNSNCRQQTVLLLIVYLSQCRF
jgi:hypothetical protein